MKTEKTGGAVSVVTWYSFAGPVITELPSEEAAKNYIDRTISNELQIDIENGHTDSEVSMLGDMFYGKSLKTYRFDGLIDIMSMAIVEDRLAVS